MTRPGRPPLGLHPCAHRVRLSSLENDALKHLTAISGVSAVALIREFVSDGLARAGALSAPTSLPPTKTTNRKVNR